MAKVLEELADPDQSRNLTWTKQQGLGCHGAWPIDWCKGMGCQSVHVLRPVLTRHRMQVQSEQGAMSYLNNIQLRRRYVNGANVHVQMLRRTQQVPAFAQPALSARPAPRCPSTMSDSRLAETVLRFAFE